MRILLILIIVISSITLDIFSKGYFSDILSENSINVIGDFLVLHLVHNSGVAFSMPIQGIFLQIITIFLLGGIIFYFIRYEYPKRSYLLDIGYSLILGGALSHAYERIAEGRVVDFIAVKYFAVLNFADIFISVGFALVIIYYIFYDRKHP